MVGVNDMPMTPLRIAALGLGYWGPNLARAWSGLAETELAWLCDLDAEALERHGRAFPEARLTTSFEEVLRDDTVEAVSIATSAPTHAALAVRALQAGKHVFVEKPLALSSADARAMAAAADEAGVLLVVGHLLVHHPGGRGAQGALRRRRAGARPLPLHEPREPGKVRSDENALWSLGAHDVAVLLHLVGERPVSCHRAGPVLHPGRDRGRRLRPAALPQRRRSRTCTCPGWIRTRRASSPIVGSDKMAVFDDMEPAEKVKVFDKGVDRVPEPASYGEYVHRPSRRHLRAAALRREPLRVQGRHFARCVRGLEVPRSGAADGLAVVEVLEALQRSLDLGGAVVDCLPLRLAA